MEKVDLALQSWILSNLNITQREMTLDQARRWQRLRMRDFEGFCRMALFGFVQRRRRDGNTEVWPENEFTDFIGEFGCKLELVLKRRCTNVSLDLFERVGRQVILSILHDTANEKSNMPNKHDIVGR